MKPPCPVDDRCSICGAIPKWRSLCQITEKYAAIQCTNCQVVCVYPMPDQDELISYYSTYNPTLESEYTNTQLVELHQPVLNYLVTKLGNNQHLSFLDYGFGSGAFLKQVANKGFLAYGVEFSEQNCKQLQFYCQQSALPISVINLVNQSLDSFADQQFDCITLFQVIEHLVDPLAVLQQLSKLQKPGGIIYLECPNNDATYLKVKNAIRKQVGRETFFSSLNPPQHIYGFNRHSMKLLLENAGYTPLEIKDYPLADGVHQVETLFWYPSLRELMQNQTLWNFYHVSKTMIRLFDPLASIFLGGGGGLYALASKKE